MCHGPNVGGGLPPMAVFQPMPLATDPPLSGASPLPHFWMCSNSDMGGAAVDGVFGGLDSGDGTTSVQPAATVQMWEGACPRWRCFSQCLWRLTRRYRGKPPPTFLDVFEQ